MPTAQHCPPAHITPLKMNNRSVVLTATESVNI